MYKTYLPIITNSTFNKGRLTKLLQKLWIDAVMSPENWFTVEYDSWTIGFLSSGSTVLEYIYLENKNFLPSIKQLEEVISYFKDKYEYNKDLFYIIDKKRCGILKEKGM